MKDRIMTFRELNTYHMNLRMLEERLGYDVPRYLLNNDDMSKEVMSLMDDYVTSCVKLFRESTADGEGGFSTVWKDSTSFPAVITLDSSSEATKAERKSETSTYTVTVVRAIDLNYHDVFKRLSDGKVFRVTSDGSDKKTPKSAMLEEKTSSLLDPRSAAKRKTPLAMPTQANGINRFAVLVISSAELYSVVESSAV